MTYEDMIGLTVTYFVLFMGFGWMLWMPGQLLSMI